MSLCLSSKDGVTARKPYRCTLCGERIAIGERHDTRTGVGDSFWTMRMHPECQRYEQTPQMRRDLADWYEDTSEPAFERSEVHRHEELQLNPRLPACDPSCGEWQCAVCPITEADLNR
jgi:hypothetical protein